MLKSFAFAMKRMCSSADNQTLAGGGTTKNVSLPLNITLVNIMVNISIFLLIRAFLFCLCSQSHSLCELGYIFLHISLYSSLFSFIMSVPFNLEMISYSPYGSLRL